jgi:hypothetical protein
MTMQRPRDRGTTDTGSDTPRSAWIGTAICTASGGARVTLDGTGSTDPDHDIVVALWHQGSRTGALVGTALQVTLPQNVGTTQQYVLQVIDSSDQVAEGSTTVRVADTTVPAISSVAASPNALRPPNHKMVQWPGLYPDGEVPGRDGQ